MPTYQYACTECGTPLEVAQSFSDAALTECPTCGGRLRKVFSAVGVVFKGSGFYRTDSRSDAKPAAKADSGPKVDAGKDSSSSSSKESGSKDAGGKTDGAAKKDAASSTTDKAAKPAKAAVSTGSGGSSSTTS